MDNKTFTGIEITVIGTGSQISERLRINPLPQEMVRLLERTVAFESHVLQCQGHGSPLSII